MAGRVARPFVRALGGLAVVAAASLAFSSVAGAGGGGGHATTTSVAGVPVQEMGVLGPKTIWAAGCKGLYLTTNGGRHWRDITPSNLLGSCVATKVSSVAVSGSHYWVGVEHVAAISFFFAPGASWLGGNGIDYSTNAGASWTPTALPFCAAVCGGNVELSFLNPDYGWAVIGPGQSGVDYLYATIGGPDNWNFLGTQSIIGPDHVNVVSTEIGWQSGGASLLRTSNRGETWTTAKLPPPSQTAGTPSAITPPAIFGAHAVLAAWVDKHAVIYSTNNGGASWTARSTGVESTAKATGPPHFSASGPRSWMLTDGATVMITHDGGATWSDSAPGTGRPPSAPKEVALATPTSAWAVWGTTLYHTTDAGTTWHAVSP